MKHFSLFLLFAILFGCGSEDNKSRTSYMANECLVEDSIIGFVEQNPKELNVISNSIIRFYFSGNKKGAFQLLTNARKSKHIRKSPFFLNNHYSDWGYYYLWEGNLDSSFYYIRLWDSLHTRDSVNNLIELQLKGNYHYLKNNIDSAKFYFSQGYRFAKQQKNLPIQERFANNLGAIAFQASMYGTASHYFADAYRINAKNEKKNKMLINNLAACYLNENDPQKAIPLLLSLKESLNVNNTSYEGALSKINYISALLLIKDLEPAKELLENIKTNDIPESLQGAFFVQKLKYLESTGYVDCHKFLQKEKENIKKFSRNILHKFGIGFVQLYQKYPEAYNYLNIENTPKEFESFDPKTKHHFHKIRSLEFERKGMMKQALFELRNANESLREYNSITDSLKVADTRANIALVELEDQLNQSIKELNYSKRINEQNRISIILLALLIIILVGFGYFIYQNRTNKIRLAQLEIDSKSREASFLEEEKLLNSRITSLSKIIINKSKELAQKIKDGPYSNEPEIYNVQKELEQLSLINATVNVSSEIEILNQDHGYLKKSDFANLNDTKKRVLILSVEQYKPKEISVTLGLSYAYVRNVQVELRKLIQQNGFSSFQELKLL